MSSDMKVYYHFGINHKCIYWNIGCVGVNIKNTYNCVTFFAEMILCRLDVSLKLWEILKDYCPVMNLWIITDF